MKAIEIFKQIKNGQRFNIFDIRQKERYEQYHLPNAIWVAKGLLIAKPKEFINKDNKYFITCNSGNSANLIVNILKKQNYNVESIIDGMNPLLKILKIL